MSQANPNARKLPAADIRRAAQRLSAAAKRAQPRLVQRVQAAIGEFRSDDQPLHASLHSIGELRRIMAARLESASRLEPGPETLPALVLDALDLSVSIEADRFDDALATLVEAIEAEPGIETLLISDYSDYPTYAGVDLLLRLQDDTGPDPKARLRIQTPETLADLAGMSDLIASILELRPRADRVAEDFGEAPDLEIFYFAELLPELGHGLEDPAGLYCLLTTEESQVACYWAADGWHPSSTVEAWIVGAEPSLHPLDGEEAAALLEAWSGQVSQGPTREMAGRR